MASDCISVPDVHQTTAPEPAEPSAVPAGETRRAAQAHRPAQIHMRLRQINQLFNAFDPAPFPEKELDGDAEQYIYEYADELPHKRPLQLVLHLPKEAIEAIDLIELEDGLRSFFAYRRDMVQRQLRRRLRDGRSALMIGVTVLFLCMTLRLNLDWLSTVNPLTEGLGEALMVLGWVALWGPIEIFLYNWWPIVARRRIYERLAELSLAVEET